MIELSIIIPLYKGNKYYKRLLDMIDQNMQYHAFYQECEVEVIFVNDYPKEKIALDYHNHKYSIKLIIQSENKGIHASRVAGLREAKGQYIIMLDQDDLVKENWLFSQWNRIEKEDGEYCVCNGWRNRFQTLWKLEAMRENVNNVQSYLTVGNPIISPGQVIIRRQALPDEWMLHIQHCNGSDDYLLWILALKKKHTFILNEEYLFYHTPERTKDSISSAQMAVSNRETQKILNELNILTYQENKLLDKLLNNIGTVCDKKFRLMFQIVYNWMQLKNRGIYINTYLKRKGNCCIAIYGMGYIGECLYEELIRTDITVSYGIDQSALDYEGRLPIYHIDEELDYVDGVVVTVARDSQRIKKMVQEKMKCHVYTMEELLINMFNDHEGKKYL